MTAGSAQCGLAVFWEADSHFITVAGPAVSYGKREEEGA